MSVWLGIDHGTRRIGIAVGDTTAAIATPLEVIAAEPESEAIATIGRLANKFHAGGLVVGWPLNMDDTEGPQAKLCRDLARRLAADLKLDVRMWDERLSSFAADQALAGKFTRKKKRARQDAVAAAAFLQDFLSAGGPESASNPEQLGNANGKK